MTGLTVEWVAVSPGRQEAGDLGADVAVLRLDRKVCHSLSGSARWVCEMLREPVGVGQVSGRLGERCEVDPERRRTEVLALLERLQEEGLVETVTVSSGCREVASA